MESDLTDRKTFLKGNLYINKNNDLIVMCTETTCNYSSMIFKGVVISSKNYAKGHYDIDWTCSNFSEKS